MKMKKFSGTAKIWSTGKVICMGSKSEEEVKIVSRRFARQLSTKIGIQCPLHQF